MVFYGIVLLLVLAAVFGPGIWVTSVIKAHETPRADFPGTGGEFARHILDRLGLHHVSVEPTDFGDHYHPDRKSVRLRPEHYNGRSLSAVVIAAHEVGHALQDRDQYKPFQSWRGLAEVECILIRAVQFISIFPIVGSFAMGIPQLNFVLLGLVVFTALVSLSLRLTSLNVEYDASFSRALPILENGYLSADDMPAARKILKAAALTYLSGALVALLRLFFIRR